MARPSLIEHSHGTSRDKRDGLGMTAMAASMHSSREWFGDPKIKKRDGLILVPSHQKFDFLESFVCSYYEV